MDKTISVSGVINGSVNFSMQQNYVPVIRSITIRNESEETVSDLMLRISFEPEFAKEYTYPVPAIPAGKSVEISPVKIILSTEYLFSLTEKMVGSITLQICF